MIIEVSRAIASAHGAGLAHLCLTPHSLRWTRTSGVKITGLGIDAALAGAGLTGMAAEDPALTDTQGLAALLYAAVTGYWPGGEQTELPPAPYSNGVLCTPRQVSAHVPPAIDAVICRALLQQPARHEPPILTTATFADALAAVAPPVPLPEPVPHTWNSGGRGPATGGYPASPNDPSSWALQDPGRGGATQSHRRRQPASDRGPAARGLISVVVVLVLVAIAATAWVLTSSLHKGTTSSGGGTTSASGSGTSSSAAAATVLKPATANAYNAYKPGDDEHGADAGNAIDGKPSTAWETESYKTATFGDLKPGTGLILDMGQSVRLSKVEVLFGSTCCTSATIYVGNNPAVSQAAFATFTKVASGSNISGDYTFPVSSAATGRYVVVWLTSLPLAPPSAGAPANLPYMGLVYEVTVRGTPAAG
jgi:hypothetical protein